MWKVLDGFEGKDCPETHVYHVRYVFQKKIGVKA
jgi:hypothetical protein